MILSSDNYFAVRCQSALGIPASGGISIPILEGSINTQFDQVDLIDSSVHTYVKESIKMKQKNDFTFSFYARPYPLGYCLAPLLGNDVLTSTIIGGTNLYIHTMTKNELRPFITLDCKIANNQLLRLYDAKINQCDISMTAGKPVKIIVSGYAAHSQNLTTTFSPPIYLEEPDGPLWNFYHGDGRFKIFFNSRDLAGLGPIETWAKSLNVSIKSGGDIQSDDEFQYSDIPDMNYSVDVTAELYATKNATIAGESYYNRLAQANFNYNDPLIASYTADSPIPTESMHFSAVEFDLRTYSNKRQMRLTIPKVTWKPVNYGFTGANQTMIDNVAGIAVKQPTTELMTARMIANISGSMII